MAALPRSLVRRPPPEANPFRDPRKLAIDYVMALRREDPPAFRELLDALVLHTDGPTQRFWKLAKELYLK